MGHSCVGDLQFKRVWRFVLFSGIGCFLFSGCCAIRLGSLWAESSIYMDAISEHDGEGWSVIRKIHGDAQQIVIGANGTLQYGPVGIGTRIPFDCVISTGDANLTLELFLCTGVSSLVAVESASEVKFQRATYGERTFAAAIIKAGNMLVLQGAMLIAKPGNNDVE